jgi:hypothetical protein
MLRCAGTTQDGLIWDARYCQSWRKSQNKSLKDDSRPATSRPPASLIRAGKACHRSVRTGRK